MEELNKIAVQRLGLKKQGVVVLQTFFIGLIAYIELWLRSGVGIVTGLTLLASFYGVIRYGRKGTTYVAVVTPPLAFVFTVLLWIVLLDGFKPSRMGIDLVAALASEAPYLIIGTLYGWFIFLNAKAKNKPSKARRNE